MKNSAQIKSTIALLVASVVWGFATTAQSIAADHVPAFLVGAIRGLFAFFFLLLVIPILDRVLHTGRQLFDGKKLDFTKTEIIGGLVCGAFLTAGAVAQQYAFINQADAGNVAFITTLYIVLIPLFELLIFRKKPHSGTWIAIPAAAVGFYFLVLYGKPLVLSSADLWSLGAAILFAGHILLTGFYAVRGDPVRISCLQFFFSFLFSSLMAILAGEEFDWTGITAAMNSLLYLGVFSGGIGFTLQTVGQKSADPTAASFILATESVFAVIGGAVMLGEHKTIPEIIGCVIIFAAVLLAQVDLSQIKGFLLSRFHKRDIADREKGDHS